MPEITEAEVTDEQLVKRAQDGDAGAFGALVERYELRMRRYAQKFLFGYEDAEDLAQEVFIKAYANIRGFDADRRFSPWIYRIAHNEFVNAIKRKKREPLPFFDADSLFPHPVAEDDPARDADLKSLREALESDLGELDPKYREPLVLYYFEELDYKEIADILRLPSSTVGVRLKRGREALRKKLEGKDIKV